MAERANFNSEPSEVQKFFKDAHIFITGGSGFLGQLLIQKLIRNCPDISKIYLLIRPKKGKTPEQRLEEMFENVLFVGMKLEQPNYNKKILLLNGDMEQPDLGLSEDDRKLITDQVNIIFHVAATVRFNEKIKKATAINVRATKDLIMLAKTMLNLQVFLYISTAYSHCYRPEIGEQFYDVPITPDRLIQISETLTDDELDVLTPKLIGSSGWPNTYTFTKAIAENVIQEYGKGLPIAIVRPSIVLSTYQDPVAGWINNFYGPIGLTAAYGLGLMHVVHMCPDVVAHLVPADYVINAMISAACHMGNTFINNSKNNPKSNIIFDELMTSNEIPIFNYNSCIENQLTWGKYIIFCLNQEKFKTVHAMWHKFAIRTSNHYIAEFWNILLHLIPAYIVDMIMFTCGKKPRLVKTYKKIRVFQETLRYFTSISWKFENDKTQELWKTLNSTDQSLFPFSLKEINWHDYFETYVRGGRIYLLKDPLETIPEAFARARKLKIAHYSLVTVLLLIILTVVYNIFYILV